jgi:hypothetical protein
MKGTLLCGPNSFSSLSPIALQEATENCHMPLNVHALRAVQIRLKLVSNEGHFTPEAETVYRPYHPSHCNGVTEIGFVVLPAHALRAGAVRLKTDSNEGHFTL